MSIGVFTFSLWSFQAFWPPILLFFHLHLLIFLDSSLWRLKFLNRLFLDFYSVRPSTLTQNTVHYRSGSTFLMQMIAQFGFRTKNNYWLLWIIKSSDTFKLAWQLSKFTRFFPTSIGSLNLKQKLSKFRLFNLSFFSTALSNYKFPIPGGNANYVIEIMTCCMSHTFWDTLRSFWSIFIPKNIPNIFEQKNDMERSCLPTLFWPINFLTHGSFGLSRTCIFILGRAIAFSKKSRLIRGSPLILYAS